jgi:hypothetical protein
MKHVQDHTELTPVEARGGGIGRQVFVMLVVSTVAAAILMGAFWTLTSVN